MFGLPGEDTVVIGQYTFLPDYNGTFDIVPDINYTCAGGLVNLNVTQLTFSEVGGTLSITGAPVVMEQTPSPVDENFSATGAITGGCTETYTLGGTFQDNDHFIGTMSLSFKRLAVWPDELHQPGLARGRLPHSLEPGRGACS